MSNGFKGVSKNNGYISIDKSDKRRSNVPKGENERPKLRESFNNNYYYGQRLTSKDIGYPKGASLEKLAVADKINGYMKDLKKDSNTYDTIESFYQVCLP